MRHMRRLSVKAYEHLLCQLHVDDYQVIDDCLSHLHFTEAFFYQKMIELSEELWKTNFKKEFMLQMNQSFSIRVEIDMETNRMFPDCTRDRICSSYVVSCPPIDQVLEPSHLVLIFKRNKGVQDSIVCPLEFIVIENEQRVVAANTYQVYEHTFIPKKAINKFRRRSRPSASSQISKDARKYVGLTSRTWQERFKEHLLSAKRGSHLLFHRQLRNPNREGFKTIGTEHVVLRAGITPEQADSVEEFEVDSRSWVVNHPKTGLNMIPGGKRGFEYLRQLHFPTKVRPGRRCTFSETCFESLDSASPELIMALRKGEKITCNRIQSTTRYDRNIELIVNRREIVRQIETISDSIKAFRSGYSEFLLPQLIPVTYSEKADERQISRDIDTLNKCLADLNKNRTIVKNRLSFQYVEHSYCWDKTPILVRHDCNRVSYVFWYTVLNHNAKPEKLSCQHRECYESITGQKLGKNTFTPSRGGISPTNKTDVDVIAREIKAFSENTLRLVEDTYTDVRSAFLVEVIGCFGVNFRYIMIGGHLNAKSKINSDGLNLYQRHYSCLTGNKPLHKRVKCYERIDDFRGRN